MTYGGTIVDTNPLPANGCPGAPNVSGGRCLTDAQVQTELQSFLSSQSKPGGLTNEYFLLTPPGVTSCFDQAATVCSANAGPGGTVVFCAYHSRTSTSGRYIYSNIPDMDDIGGCDPFAFGSNADCNTLTCIWPNGWADGVLSAVSHEHNETITDPQPNNAWADWGSGGNNRGLGDENGDKCNGDADADPDTNLRFDSNTFDYSPYNETINGRQYWIQREWSNQSLACVNHWSPSGPMPGAAFQVQSQSGNTVNFDATASCGGNCSSIAQYVWQFNDNTNPGQAPQNVTVKATNPVLSHTFPHPGTYTVALTTMGPDARSHGVSANVRCWGPSARCRTSSASR